MSEQEGYELDWDSPIEKDGPDYILLSEGEYEFEVTNLERGRHSGSDKLPPCKKVTLHLKIQTAEGLAIIKHNLFLYSSVEGLLTAFFTCIGARKKGERLFMNWDSVLWARGRAQVGIREYKTDSGEKRQTNEVKRFLPPPESKTGANAPKAFVPGRF